MHLQLKRIHLKNFMLHRDSEVEFHPGSTLKEGKNYDFGMVSNGVRKSQIGDGDRSGRIRTYNYPQGRVTDHRIGLTLYKLEGIMQGDLDELIEELNTFYQAKALQNAESNHVKAS